MDRGVRAEPEREVTMRRKVILVTVIMALVRVVIASASPVVDAVLVALAVLLLATVWDELTNARP
jgi:phosphate starvation-inducible membrane PsiE